MVHDRKRDQAVLGDGPCHVFLIIRRMRIQHIRVHDLFHRLGFAGSKKFLYVYLADQLALLRDIAGIDGLFVDTDLADLQDGLCNRHLFSQRDIVYVHHASRAVLRILEQLVDLDSCLLIRGHQKPVHHIGRHLLQNVYRIV